MRAVRLLSLLACVAVTACTPPAAKNGALALSPADAAPSDASPRALAVDFGEVTAGVRTERRITLHNVGEGPLTLTGLERTGGDAAFATGSSAATFKADFTSGESLAPGATRTLTLAFTPPTSGEADAYSVTLRLLASGAEEGTGEATLTLGGRRAPADCVAVEAVDFGAELVGGKATLSLTLKNPGVQPAHASVGAVSGEGAAAFRVEAGALEVPAGGEKAVTVQFQPATARAFTASLPVRPAERCPEQQVALRGEGVASLLAVDSALDFGLVAPGTSLARPLSVRNLGHQSLSLTLTLAGSGAAAFHAPATLTLPAGDTQQVTVDFRPEALGASQASLELRAALAGQPALQVALTGFGGGPRLALTRTELPFGPVAYVAGREPASPKSLTFRVRNVGLAPVGEGGAQLKLGRGGEAPLIEVRPRDASTVAADFTVEVEAGYSPEEGLAPDASLLVTVRPSPTSPGPKQAELVLVSNDALQPEVVLPVSATLSLKGACQYTLSQQAVELGVVAAGRTAQQTLTFRNTSTQPHEVCWLSGVKLAAGAGTGLSIPSPGSGLIEVAPQASVAIQVRASVPAQQYTAQPTTTSVSLVPDEGQLALQVPVHAQLGVDCLQTVPGQVAFGSAPVGCRTLQRTVRVHNVCSVAADLTALEVVQGGSEFTVEALSSSVSLAPGASTDVTVRYRPQDVGVDVGGLALRSTLAATPVTYSLRLSGAGGGEVARESVVQPLTRKVDVLLVVDDVGAPLDARTGLSLNLGALQSRAQALGADFQLGLTTSSVGTDLPSGALQGSPRVLEGSAPDFVAQATQRLAFPMRESGSEATLEAAALALTPPLSAGTNAGLVRPGADLALLVLTNAPDKSSSNHTAELFGVKGAHAPESFAFHAVAPFQPTAPESCTYEATGDDGRYTTLLERTGGLGLEVCQTLGGAQVEQLAQRLFGPRNRVRLGSAPALEVGALTVQVDGQPLPATTQEGAEVWRYQPEDRVVRFAPGHEPAAGSTVELAYPLTCE